MKKITCIFARKNIFPISQNLVNNNTFSLGRLRSNNYCSKFSGIVDILNISNNAEKGKRMDFKSGPGLSDFISASTEINYSLPSTTDDSIPYLDNNLIYFREQKVFFDVYGCQMNVNDTEIVWSILKSNNYIKTNTREEADVILVMTCAIREGAESKIWSHLDHLRGLKKRQAKLNHQVKIGILGCMAERLKHKLIEKEQAVDIVAGPDSYKDLPRLLAITDNNQTAVNVILSLDETYADIIPVRLNSNSKSAFVSIMRGCDNMCSYCIVPFTRGRERSRPLDSIVNEIKLLSEQGVKEVTLLGQNVNSYRYLSEPDSPREATNQVKGFKTVYKVKTGGLRFADLLEKVSAVNTEMRIRFTSPHPKDFPDELLQLVKERPNICKSLHLPVQSGNSAVLERMRRGYTREAYLDLIEHVREVIPNVGLSSDFICGFCHETDEEFDDTLTLMEKVKYNVAYLFAYSMREKTTAHRRYKDDVPHDVKQARLVKMVEVYRRGAEELNAAQVGEVQVILVEGKSKKSGDTLFGRNDANLKVLIPAGKISSSPTDCLPREISAGDYIAVKIHSSNSQILKGTPLFHTSLSSFDRSISDVEVSKLKSVVL